MAITLAQAETQLSEALAALSKARESAAYSIADRSSTRQALEVLQKDVRLWERKVRELTALQNSAPNPGYMRPKWT